MYIIINVDALFGLICFTGNGFSSYGCWLVRGVTREGHGGGGGGGMRTPLTISTAVLKN